MAIEKSWVTVGPVALSAPGSTRGHLTVTSTLGFKVKMIVALTQTSLPPLKLEIKRITSGTQLEVGMPGTPITDRVDVSAYTPPNAYLLGIEQKRPSIPLQEIERATYEEEPTVAWRNLLVDPFGSFYTTENPIPVQLTDGNINIGTINANLSVALDHRDNHPNPGDIADSVRIGDGVNEMDVNNDGSINVNIIQPPVTTDQVVLSYYNEALSVASGIQTVVQTYIVPFGKTAYLQRVSVNGENIADYTIYYNGNVIDRKRTYFGASLNEQFEFIGTPTAGLTLIAGDTIQVKVLHSRPYLADFGARIQVLQVG